MKKNFLLIVSLAFGGLVLGGCAADKGAYSGNIKDDAVPVESASSETISAESSSVTPDFNTPAKEVDDERSIDGSLLSQRLVYFEYDKSIVPNEALNIIDAHIDFLIRNPAKKLIIAGHTDERGSNEYNLALGQRRADAVRDIMLRGGVPNGQIESISFGESAPIDNAINESAWQKNRRAELRYADE